MSTCLSCRPLQLEIAAAPRPASASATGAPRSARRRAWTTSFIASSRFAVSTCGSSAPWRLVTRSAIAIASWTTSCSASASSCRRDASSSRRCRRQRSCTQLRQLVPVLLRQRLFVRPCFVSFFRALRPSRRRASLPSICLGLLAARPRAARSGCRLRRAAGCASPASRCPPSRTARRWRGVGGFDEPMHRMNGDDATSGAC